MNFSTFSCLCDKKKQHKLVFDGGILGEYTVEVYSSCFVTHTRKFLIQESTLDITSEKKGVEN